MAAPLPAAARKLLEGDTAPSVILVAGDLVLADPVAGSIADELARRAGVEVDRRRRPATLEGVLGDLNTYALFGGGKVVLALDTAILADRQSAAELVDQAAEALPLSEGDDLAGAEREAASRLVQALHVFGLGAGGGRDASRVLGDLPKWALQGGAGVRKKKPRGRSAKDVKTLQEGLAELLEKAVAAGVVGFPEGDLARLEDAVRQGLPPGHHLVLAERSAAKDHPLVQRLREAGAVVPVASVEAGRRGELSGVEDLARGLREETGVAIAPDGLEELVRRTLRQDRGAVDSDSTARFAAEYRKLAHQVGSGPIRASDVSATVQDRGDEDVWKILDAVGEGRGGEALARVRRLLATAENRDGELLRFFGLIAGFCRQLVAVAGLVAAHRLPTGERNYRRFESDLAPRLQVDLPGGRTNPVAKLHPFRLFRSYRAAVALAPDMAARLPWWLLETELRIKGESSDAALALESLVARLASATSASRR